jgi:hypothetical protein
VAVNVEFVNRESVEEATFHISWVDDADGGTLTVSVVHGISVAGTEEIITTGAIEPGLRRALIARAKATARGFIENAERDFMR